MRVGRVLTLSLLVVIKIRGSCSRPNDEDVDKIKDIKEKRDFISEPQTLTLDGFHIRLDPESEKFISGEKREFPPAAALADPLYTKGGLESVDIEPIFKDIHERKYADRRSVPVGQNLLTNPSFELPLSSHPVTAWSCQGETDDPRGAVMARYSRDRHGYGKYSGVCYGRLSEWAGPGQYIGRKVKSGAVYKFLGYTKLVDSKNTRDLHSLELWMRFKRKHEKKQHTMRLAIRNKYTNNAGWIKWRTSFEMPVSSAGYQYVFLFFKGPKASVDIIVDDVSLKEIHQDRHWKDKTDKLIEKYRKRDVKIRISVPSQSYSVSDLARIDIKVKQKRHKFGFGAAINSNSLVRNKKYRDFFLKHFQWAVLENSMKWTRNEARKGKEKYKEADAAMKILEKNKVQHWDVNNEMLHGSFFADTFGGRRIRKWMFKRTAKLDPEAKLFLNEFDVIADGQLTQAYVEQANNLIRHRVGVDGIGAQGHFTGKVNPVLLRVRLNDLSEIKLPVWLTEVDIVDHNPTRRADSLEAVMRVAFSHPNVQGLLLWVFWENNSWRGPNAALADGTHFKLNAAGQRYVTLLRKWKTNEHLKPASADYNGISARFRGFHGDYEVSVTLPDGVTVKREFSLEPGKSTFNFDIDIQEDPNTAFPAWSTRETNASDPEEGGATDATRDDEEQDKDNNFDFHNHKNYEHYNDYPIVP